MRVTEKALERLEVVDKPFEKWELQLLDRRGGAQRRRRAAARRGRSSAGSFRLGPIDLEIGWAERVGILGPNGVGQDDAARRDPRSPAARVG